MLSHCTWNTYNISFYWIELWFFPLYCRVHNFIFGFIFTDRIFSSLRRGIALQMRVIYSFNSKNLYFEVCNRNKTIKTTRETAKKHTHGINTIDGLSVFAAVRASESVLHAICNRIIIHVLVNSTDWRVKPKLITNKTVG